MAKMCLWYEWNSQDAAVNYVNAIWRNIWRMCTFNPPEGARDQQIHLKLFLLNQSIV